jgi:hypothetical protein
VLYFFLCRPILSLAPCVMSWNILFLSSIIFPPFSYLPDNPGSSINLVSVTGSLDQQQNWQKKLQEQMPRHRKSVSSKEVCTKNRAQMDEAMKASAYYVMSPGRTWALGAPAVHSPLGEGAPLLYPSPLLSHPWRYQPRWTPLSHGRNSCYTE